MSANEILQRARDREAARDAAYVPIDYARMNKIGRSQKAALTRAINSGDRDKMIETCAKAVAEWDEIGAWPDYWSRWQRALDDMFPVFHAPRLEDLR
jgi:hypothetical protein